MLRRHISARHSLNPDEYLKRWGLRRDHPLTAPAYSEQRSTMAKQLGLGRKPKAQVAPAATRAAPVSADADPKTRANPRAVRAPLPQRNPRRGPKPRPRPPPPTANDH